MEVEDDARCHFQFWGAMPLYGESKFEDKYGYLVQRGKRLPKFGNTFPWITGGYTANYNAKALALAPMFDEPYGHDCEKEIAVDIDFDRTGSLAKFSGPREHAVIGRAISYAEYKDVDCDDQAMKTDYQYSYVVCSATEAESILAQALPHVPTVISAKSDPHRVVVPIDIFVFCIRYRPTNTRHHMRLDEFLSHLATKTAVDVHFYTSEESAPVPQRFPAANVVTLFRQRDATPVNEQNPSVVIAKPTKYQNMPDNACEEDRRLRSEPLWEYNLHDRFETIVIDEAYELRNQTTIRNKTIRFLFAPFILLVTANNIPRPEELPPHPQP
ncbi:MAG: hypothetical protein M1822_004508 [Bathelium mastoideum]|nr:MAG: hypothetical protein M1822_004508 [Bathelium mastoideum]